MTIGRICTRDVDIAEPDEFALAAAKRMSNRWVGSLLVLNDEEEPVGILTDRDLATRILADGRNPAETRVSEVMTTAPEVLPEDASIEEALSLMRSGGFRRVPVVDAEEKLIGVITLDDILDLLAEEFGAIAELLAPRIARKPRP